MAATAPTTRAVRSVRSSWLGALALLVAGAALVPAAEWVVHAAAGTTETRGVLADVDVVERSGRAADTYDAVAVTADGRGIALMGAGAGARLTELPLGSPVIVTRSTADGQVLEVRTPLETVDVDHHWGAIVLGVLGLAVFAAGGWFGLLLQPRRAVAALLVVAGLLGSYLALPPRHDLGPWSGWIPDAMAGYPDPPTGPADPYGRRVSTVVPIGTPVTQELKHRTTVTGPPEAGLPPGADPAVAAGFTVLRVPLLAEPGPDAGAYGAEGGYVPNMILVGSGRGTVTELSRSPACAGAPDALPAYFAAPRRGYVCFAVPDGFVPGYLVIPQSDLAVDLRGQGVATTSR